MRVDARMPHASGLSRHLIVKSAALLFALVACPGQAVAEWQYWIGIHDFEVPDVSSHTYGIAGGASFDERPGGDWHYFGDLDLFWDHDKDHLDPDHIPIWWQAHIGTDGQLLKFSRQFHLDWTADLNTRANTVSSIERQFSALPALALRYDGENVEASLKGGVGYWFLEIDDDAPRERGYDRDDLRNTTFAESLGGHVGFNLGKSFKLVGRAQEWWDGSTWLYTHYAGEVHFALDHRDEHSEIVLDAEVNEYNLDMYNKPGQIPVLPWNDDLLIRLFFVTKWK
jgi:hypothetical protein